MSRVIAGCDKLWKTKSTEARRSEMKEDNEDEDYINNGEEDQNDRRRTEDGCCGRGWIREDYTLCIIGNDVVSIFPSLDSENTGKIVRQEVARSTMNIDGFNTRLGVK